MLLHAADTLKQRITLALGSLALCTALTLSALYQRADLAVSALMASGDVDQCADQPASTLQRQHCIHTNLRTLLMLITRFVHVLNHF